VGDGYKNEGIVKSAASKYDSVAVLWLLLASALWLGAGVVLIVLRLAQLITWPWLWVTLPFWGPVSVALTLASLMVIFALTLLWLE
jgi:hypothetical protein